MGGLFLGATEEFYTQQTWTWGSPLPPEIRSLGHKGGLKKGIKIYRNSPAPQLQPGTLSLHGPEL